MRDSASTWLIIENAKIFRSYVKHFSISHVKEIVESWLVYVKKFLWIIQSCILVETIKQSYCQLLFSYFLELLWEKSNRYSLSAS